jgi:hypothetical protein
VGGHFQPFTEVQNGNQREVTGKAGFAILQPVKTFGASNVKKFEAKGAVVY